MNRRLLFLVVAVSLVLVAAAPMAASARASAARPPSIEGTWNATDTFDGSRMRLWIRADRDIDSLYDIRYFDQSCGGCAGLPGTGRFVGFMVEEYQIHGTGYFRSQGYTYFYQLDGDWFYDPNTDTITEYVAGFEQTWYRAAAD
jgi:hypothetical protein